MKAKRFRWPMKPLLLLLSSIWSPAIWLLTISATNSAFEGQLLTKYLAGHVIWPTITLWAAAGIINLSIYGIALRLGEAPTILFVVLSVPIPIFLIFIVALVSSIGGGFVYQPTSASSIKTLDNSTAMLLALFVAAFSIPAWITLAIKGPKPLSSK